VTDASSRARPAEARAVRAYVAQGNASGHDVETIDKHDFVRLPEFDATFLRLDTHVGGLSFAVSRYAWELGLRVVDDPQSMITCMNKAHVQGLLEQAGVPTPDTVLLTPAGRQRLDAEAVFTELGSPVVCKAPSGAFSSAVERAHDARQLRALVRRFSSRSDVVLLQRYEPSAFDWRVGILCDEIIFVCRYHIPSGAWRIRDRVPGETRRRWARIERVVPEDAPTEVIRTAIDASRTIGRGLYGVDLKQRDDGSLVVIEVNDNPNMDAGGELDAESDAFGRIVDLIATRGPRR
jgi:glutathione synthase/RimK-type ligase-like ATP-grasp enzyme